MDAQFWHQRWAQKQIGFHLDAVNPCLTDHWSKLQIPAGSKIFVPLCGKSRDLLWLAAQGYRVMGIEVSPIAVADFFKENSLIADVSVEGALEVWSSGEVTIFCGDFFELSESDCSNIHAVYDRASLIAFPQAMRADYVEKLYSLLPEKIPTLLVTLEYQQHEMQGPPFAVNKQEVDSLYRMRGELIELASEDVLAAHTHFRKKGLSTLWETVYSLK